MSPRYFGLLLTAMLPLGAGCASTLPPKQLLDARAAFADAANGPAAQQDPADLELARQALVRAEKAYADDPDSEKTRDIAYVAEARARTADARGRQVANERIQAAAEAQFKATAVNKIDSKNAALGAKDAALVDQAARAQATGMALIAEQQRRTAAEARLREAMDRLSALAAIKDEPRGVVITLSGAVLFATDKSDLLPTAAERLNEVADALNAQPDRAVTVLGFTDSRGDSAHNQVLSERRAMAVRNYLISRGVAPDQLTAVGKGAADPVADNASAEGRANNRRVEIVIAHPKKTE